MNQADVISFDFANLDPMEQEFRRYRVNRFILSPPQWAGYPERVSLRWEWVPFGLQDLHRVPDDKCGVYSFVVTPGIADHPACSYLMYVGKADGQSLKKRYTSYVYELGKRKPRPLIYRMIRNWSEHLWFCFAAIDDIGLIDEVESDLLRAFLPPHNTQLPADISPAVAAAFS